MSGRASRDETVDIPNRQQALAWNGEEGQEWIEHADQYDRAGQRHCQRLLDTNAIRSSDRVLDIGCGTGKSSRDAARLAGDGTVVGLDLSEPMLELARIRAESEGLTNVAFVQGDAQVHPLGEHEFDIAISAFGCMFFDDPLAAFANVAHSIRPSGRIALLVWRELTSNEWLMAIRAALAMGRDLPVPPPDAPTPFSLADPARVESILGAAGLCEIDLETIDEPIQLGLDASDAFSFMKTLGIVRGLLNELDDPERSAALDNLRSSIDAHGSRDGVFFGSAAWLITARR